MAKTTPKRGKVKPIRANQPPPDQPDGSDPADPDSEVRTEDEPSPQAAQQAEPVRKGRPPGPRDATQSTILPFFRRVAAVNREDWGTRFKIKVYRLAPIIDRLRGSENKYITIYEEPITEEKVKHDHGSGRYRLYLSCKSPAQKEEKEVDRIEFDILDMNFPPKVPPGEWVEDARNKPWAWAKPAGAGEQPRSASDNVLETFRVFNEIQDSVSERTKPQTETGTRPSPTEELSTVVAVAKDLAALQAPREATVPAFIQEEMKAVRAELAESRKSNSELMMKFFEAKTAPAQERNGLGTIKEILNGVKEFLPTLRDLWPATKEAVEQRAARSHMGPWQEFFQPVLPSLVDAIAPIIPAMAQKLAGEPRPSVPPFPNMPPRPLPSPGMNQGVPREPNLDAMLLNALGNERTGGDFADSILTLFGPLLYRQICSLGEAGMLAMLQQRPVWQQLGALQSKMPEFIHEFVGYGEDGGPDEEQQPAGPGANTEQPPIDLTAEVAGDKEGGMA